MYTQLKPDSYFMLDWRKQPASGGPVLINLIHEIDLARFVFGEIECLQAMSANAVRGFAVEDTASVVLRFRNGALGTISVSDTAATPFTWDLTSGEFDLMTNTTGKIKRPRAHSHVFAGNKGSVTLPTLEHYYYSGRTEPGWLSDLEQETLAVGPVNAYVEQARHFAAVARRETAPLVSGRDGLRTLEATLAVRDAAASGRTVSFAA
jgi:predicted dehydrogenase